MAQQLVCFPEAAAGQPWAQVIKKLLAGQGDDHACGHECLRAAMDQEPSVNYPPLNTEAQGRPIPIPKTLALHEPKADRLPWGGCDKVDLFALKVVVMRSVREARSMARLLPPSVSISRQFRSST